MANNSTTVNSWALDTKIAEDVDNIRLFDERFNYNYPAQKIAPKNFPKDFNNIVVLPENLEDDIEQPEAKESSSTLVNLDFEKIVLNDVTTLNDPIPLEVDTTADTINNDGLRSLREAIIEANSDPDRDYVIELQGGETYNLTISGTGENNAATGDLDIIKGANITIRATGTEKATIKANSIDRVFHVLKDGSLTLENLRITGGDPNGSFGGGIRSTDGNVTVLNSIFEGNKAGRGGAIDFGGSSNSNVFLNIKGSLFLENTSDTNGAALTIARGQYLIDTTEIINNNAGVGGRSFRSGGGIAITQFAEEGVISDSTIRDNTHLNGNGAGLSLGAGNLILENTKIIANRSSDNGGGIYQSGDSDSEMIVTRGEISSNIATDSGGGVYIASGKAEFRNISINNNQGITGGGTYIETSQTVSFDNSDFTKNTSTLNGGAGYSESTIILNNVEHIDNESGGDGGAWKFSESSTAEISHSLFEGNFAEGKGGAIEIEESRRSDQKGVNIQSSTFDNNQANGSGGAINVDGEIGVIGTGFNNSAGKLTISYSTFTNNRTAENGGAIHNRGLTRLNYVTISGNSAAGDGGGIAATNGVGAAIPCVIGTCNFFEAEASTMAVENSTIANNEADSDENGEGNGGNIYAPLQTQDNSQPGVYIYFGTMSLFNAIVADGIDSSRGEQHPDISRTVYANYSLIENTSGTTIFGSNNIVEQDPKLEELGNNGGATMTHNLLAGSPAIDAGLTVDSNALDQNRNSSVIGVSRDIGSVEFQTQTSNQPPRVINPIADVEAKRDDSNLIIDLTDVFRDPDGDEITLSIQSNSNAEIVTLSLDGNNLTLDFLDNKIGTAEIKIGATAEGGFVDDTFTIQVEPPDLPGDDPPEVLNPIADVRVEQNAADKIIDLNRVFIDVDSDDIEYTIVSNSNSELVRPLLNDNDLTLDFLDNQSGTAEITIRATADEQSVEDSFTVTVNSPVETIELFRFRNINFNTGTYVFVSAQERDAILADPNLSRSFELEGVNPDGSFNPAFVASTQDRDDLLPFFRIKSLETLGTFLFVSTAEYDAIFAEDSDQKDKWEKEGFDTNGRDIPEFYLFGVGANQGTPFNRFQNRANNTFLFAGPEETEIIRTNPDFSKAFFDQGGAFEAF